MEAAYIQILKTKNIKILKPQAKIYKIPSTKIQLASGGFSYSYQNFIRTVKFKDFGLGMYGILSHNPYFRPYITLNLYKNLTKISTKIFIENSSIIRNKLTFYDFCGTYVCDKTFDSVDDLIEAEIDE